MAGLALAPGALPRSILFVCGMNAVRSPMAEQLARRMLPATIFVASAGVRAGERDPFVDAVLAEEGLSLGERHPRTLDDLEDDYFDLIVTLAPEAHHAALELTRSLAVEVEYWPTQDPTGASGTREQIMAAYREVRERLKLRISRRFLASEAKNATD
ncbi:low molecular weight phosphatase family protein [Mesorhizobium loti]|uniref:Low molecular weight phosphatase family protein n=2 Tax=Phyllobacteriaceae TaxID=69277 RepID=A0A6M7TFE7_9HYPH|nr:MULTISPECIES: low molecular weight phosphatase family protein [Mesorhizobium]AID27977.2 protein-tyrosine-phosphatase [Mesorhizobium huakuii 7653R]QKC63036.1 low molecular weight phosphatase family protein [Mesorhizobium jarvisii]QKD08947.1 low molecular weight phosphatase family protein [Mesorhizobium loti]RJT29986.1 low molecular weight phosphatase family protein [Mesorhizobium jarvisii]